jgi:signal transduction histidine kinase
MPLVVSVIAISLIQLTIVAYFGWISNQSRAESLLRFNEEISLGISQGNRTLIESAMAHAKTELNAVSISLCQNGKSVLELPPAANGCASTGSASLLEERIPILGSSDFVAQVSISFFREFGLQFGVIIAAFALLVSVSILFLRASRALRRDLVAPLQLDLADDAKLTESIPTMAIHEVAHIFTDHLAKVNSIRNLALENERMARLAAIAQVTQMLAHDVRRPLQLVKATFDLLKKAKTLEQIEKITATASANIGKATAQAEGLISDVMELGAKSEVVTESIEPAALIRDAIENVKEIFPTANVELSVDVRTKECVAANKLKMERVIANIVGNAYQALRQRGKVWFVAEDIERDGARLVQFSIGNNGPQIAEEDLPKLFDSFFTKGKSGGTGLGLAIAQKVVHAHGGIIWCESGTSNTYPNGFVVFKCTLPIVSLNK